MNNVSTSECSSGCESGWTMYLDQHSNSTDTYFHHSQKMNGYIQEDNEDEDLSMVSDASSGPPPRFYGYENYGTADISHFYQETIKSNKQKSKTKEPRIKNKQSLCLDDTASSPIFQDNVVPVHDYRSMEQHVPGFSAAHFESESITKKKHLGFFKSSIKGKSGSLKGRKRQ